MLAKLPDGPLLPCSFSRIRREYGSAEHFVDRTSVLVGADFLLVTLRSAGPEGDDSPQECALIVTHTTSAPARSLRPAPLLSLVGHPTTPEFHEHPIRAQRATALCYTVRVPDKAHPQIRSGELRQVFRSEENRIVDAHIARLCVLYEDLNLELSAITADDIPEYRRYYFLRRSIGTLCEFAEGVRLLNACPEFEEIKTTFDAHAAETWDLAVTFFKNPRGRYQASPK